MKDNLEKAKALIYESVDEILSGGCKVQIALHLEKALEHISEVEEEVRTLESLRDSEEHRDPMRRRNSLSTEIRVLSRVLSCLNSIKTR